MKRNKSFENKSLLYLVSTPIGNLKEVSSRTIEVLSMVDLIAAEDTRNTSHLLSNINVKKPLFSLHEHNEKEASQTIISKIKEGKNVAYVSDAGYPGISDPGSILVQEAIKNDIAISVVSGSSAFLAGLIPSGLDTSHFFFYGFLSSKDSEATKEAEGLVKKKETIIFYESPHRILRTFNILYETFGNRRCCLARELTKINEEYIRGTLKEFIKIDVTTLKGEMVIILEGLLDNETVDENGAVKRYHELIKRGLTNKQAKDIVVEEYKIKSNDLKSLLMNK